jgi:hypothetical protein
MDEKGFDVAGVRTDGMISGWVERVGLGATNCSDYCQPFLDSQLVDESLPLASLVLRLNEQPRLFVLNWGHVCGVVSRIDIEKPPSRMWLFGVISIIETRWTRLIERNCPAKVGRSFFSPSRIVKAEELLNHRRQDNRRSELTDCLQLSDKVQIVARNERLRNMTRLESRTQAERVGKKLEKLRNNLAHSQEIIANNWETIVLIVENFDSVLDGPGEKLTEGGNSQD